MKKRNNRLNGEFTERLASSNWDRQMEARVALGRHEQIVRRTRWAALATGLVAMTATVMLSAWEEEVAGGNLYSMMEQATETIGGHLFE